MNTNQTAFFELGAYLSQLLIEEREFGPLAEKAEHIDLRQTVGSAVYGYFSKIGVQLTPEYIKATFVIARFPQDHYLIPYVIKRI
jgi:hypothetical protein